MRTHFRSAHRRHHAKTKKLFVIRFSSLNFSGIRWFSEVVDRQEATQAPWRIVVIPVD
jgi:hypothetical protein